MIGVRFNTPVKPYGAGDVAMVPEGVAEALEKSGEATLCDMPAAFHAHEAGYKPEVTKPVTPTSSKPSLITKKTK